MIAIIIKDVVTGQLDLPVFFHTMAEANRELSQLVNNPKTKVSQYPQDFEFIEIGSYDSTLGVFVQSAHRVLGKASDWVQKSEVTPIV